MYVQLSNLAAAVNPVSPRSPSTGGIYRCPDQSTRLFCSVPQNVMLASSLFHREQLVRASDESKSQLIHSKCTSACRLWSSFMLVPVVVSHHEDSKVKFNIGLRELCSDWWCLDAAMPQCRPSKNFSLSLHHTFSSYRRVVACLRPGSGERDRGTTTLPKPAGYPLVEYSETP